jgi:large subunit ribosomal protein L11
MAKDTIKSMVEGGKATAAPPLGPALGPKGVNIGQVISAINKKTEAFKGMQVPIKVIIDTDTKEFSIEVGTPPASALIKKEAGIEKGSGSPKADKVADILIEQIIKIAKMKEGNLLGKTLKERVKEIIGTCNSMGVLVEGVPAREAIAMVNEGKFDAEIKSEKTELTAEELKHLEEEKQKLKEEIEKRRAHYEALAKQIVEQMAGKESGEIRSKMKEAKIPLEIIDAIMPAVGKVAAGAEAVAAGVAPAAGAKAEAKPAAEKKK